MEGRVCDFETAVGAFEESIDTFERSICLFGVLLGIRAELEGMCADNAQRALNDQSPAYSDEAFRQMTVEVSQVLHGKIKLPLPLKG